MGTLIVVKYISINNSAEQASVVSIIGTLNSALDIYSVQQIVNIQTIAAHNPFVDLSVQPPNYAGEFGDVTDLNCPAGYWAYQSGNASNGNWPVLVYRPKSTLQQAFVWNNLQWVIWVINENKNASGTTISLSIDYYPPAPVW